MLVSGVQHTDFSVCVCVCECVYIPFSDSFPYKLLQDIKCISLCYTVGPCWLSILYIVVCTCQSQTPQLSLPPTLPPW